MSDTLQQLSVQSELHQWVNWESKQNSMHDQSHSYYRECHGSALVVESWPCWNAVGLGIDRRNFGSPPLRTQS